MMQNSFVNVDSEPRPGWRVDPAVMWLKLPGRKRVPQLVAAGLALEQRHARRSGHQLRRSCGIHDVAVSVVHDIDTVLRRALRDFPSLGEASTRHVDLDHVDAALAHEPGQLSSACSDLASGD